MKKQSLLLLTLIFLSCIFSMSNYAEEGLKPEDLEIPNIENFDAVDYFEGSLVLPDYYDNHALSGIKKIETFSEKKINGFPESYSYEIVVERTKNKIGFKRFSRRIDSRAGKATSVTKTNETIVYTKIDRGIKKQVFEDDLLLFESFTSFTENGKVKKSEGSYYSRSSGEFDQKYDYEYTYENGLLKQVVFTHIFPEGTLACLPSVVKKNYTYEDSLLKKVERELGYPASKTFQYDAEGRIASISYVGDFFNDPRFQKKARLDKYEYLNEHDYNVSPYSDMTYENIQTLSGDRMEHREKQDGDKTIISDTVITDGKIVYCKKKIWRKGNLIETQQSGLLQSWGNGRLVFHY